MKPRIAPSILAMDFYNPRPQIAAVRAAGAEILHVDVMDGIFVPNISVGVPVVRSLSRSCGMTTDVHLMISGPERYINAFAEAGADWLTVHLEAAGNAGALLRQIRSAGLKAGLAINPDTAVRELEPYAHMCDVILVMTVPPGFGGQGYGPESNARIAEARALIDRLNPGCVLSVDGGINAVTIGGAYKAGARLFAAGTAVFGEPDPGAAFRDLLSLCV